MTTPSRPAGGSPGVSTMPLIGPNTMEQIQRKVRRLLRPIQRTAEYVDRAAESAVQERTPTV